MDHVEPSVLLSYASFYWISGMVYLAIIFHKGGCKVIPGPFEPRKLLQTIEECKVSGLFLYHPIEVPIEMMALEKGSICIDVFAYVI